MYNRKLSDTVAQTLLAQISNHPSDSVRRYNYMRKIKGRLSAASDSAADVSLADVISIMIIDMKYCSGCMCISRRVHRSRVCDVRAINSAGPIYCNIRFCAQRFNRLMRLCRPGARWRRRRRRRRWFTRNLCAFSWAMCHAYACVCVCCLASELSQDLYITLCQAMRKRRTMDTKYMS